MPPRRRTTCSCTLWIAVFGDSPTALRLPPMLAMPRPRGSRGPRRAARRPGVPGCSPACCSRSSPATSRYGQEARPVRAGQLRSRCSRPCCWWRPCAGRLVPLGRLRRRGGPARAMHLIALTLLAAQCRPRRCARPRRAARDGTGAAGPAARARWGSPWFRSRCCGPLLLRPGPSSPGSSTGSHPHSGRLAAVPGGVAQSGRGGRLLVGVAARASARLGPARPAAG